MAYWGSVPIGNENKNLIGMACHGQGAYFPVRPL
jgi:hypothetical protein